MKSYKTFETSEPASEMNDLSRQLKRFTPIMVVIGAIVMTAYAALQGSLSVFIAYSCFGFVGFAIVIFTTGYTQARIYLTIYGMAAIAAVVLAWDYTNAYGAPYWGGGSDEFFFENNGIAYAQKYGVFDYSSIRGDLVYEWESTVAYIYIIGLLAKFSELFGGFHTMVPRLFNAMCLSLIAALSYQLCIRLQLKHSSAIIAAFSSGAFPYLMWISVQSLRDIIQALLVLLVAYLWVPDRDGRWLYPIPLLILMSVLSVVPLWEMRKGQAIVVLLLVGVSFITNRRSWTPLNLLMLTPIYSAIAVYGIVTYYPVFEDAYSLYTKAAPEYAEYQARGGTQQTSGLSAAVFQAPLFPVGWLFRFVYALISPLPTTVWPLYYGWLSAGTIIQIVFLPFLFIGLRYSLQSSQWRIIGLAFLSFFVAMSMFTFTIRHSTYWMIFAIPLVALGWERYTGNHLKLIKLMAVLASSFGLAYFVLKG